MTQALITRSQWGAKEQDGTGPRPLPISEWWLHHDGSGTGPDGTLAGDTAWVRNLEVIGESRFGAGISYTFPVAPRSGRIFQGHTMPRVGTHTRGHNTVGGAFVVGGNYMTRRMPAPAREAIARRMVIEHREGRATRHTLNGGHTQASSPDGGTLATDCPGDMGLLDVPVINARAVELWAAGYPANDPDQTGDDMSDVQVKNPATGALWSIEDALWSIWTYTIEGRNAAREASRDAAVARALAEAAAAAPGALSPEDVQAITASTVEAVDAHLDARDRALAEALAGAGAPAEEGQA